MARTENEIRVTETVCLLALYLGLQLFDRHQHTTQTKKLKVVEREHVHNTPRDKHVNQNPRSSLPILPRHKSRGR